VRYLVLLYGDEAAANEPGTEGFDAEMAGYEAFGELAGDAIVAGEALLPTTTSRTVRVEGGEVRVTDGPFAEVAEALGGFYVLEAPTLDDAIELVRHIPATADGAVEVRPLVDWFDRGADGAPAGPGVQRYVATIHGPEGDGDVPGTPAWDEGAAAHGAFAERAGAALRAGGAVHPVATATTVRVRDGALLATDGPFAEAVEVVGGLYVLAGTVEEVVALAALVPVDDDGAVDLRPIMELDG
jgi:hypothetical protein